MGPRNYARLTGLILSFAGLSLFYTNCSNNVQTTDYSSSSEIATTTFTLNYAGLTIGYGQSVILSASGGSGSYTISKTSGGGTLDSSSWVYTAPLYNTTAVLKVVDSDGYYQSFYLYSSSSANSTLTISASESVIGHDGSSAISVTGGLLPYTLSIYSGSGTLSDYVFYPTTASDTVIIQVRDFLGTVSRISIRVMGDLTISGSGTIRTDHQVGVSFDGVHTDVDGTDLGSLVFFSMGTTISASTINSNVSGCTLGSGIDMTSPCVLKIPLTNYSITGDYGYVYKGTVTAAGRSATVSFSFCIRPTEPTKLYMAWNNTSTLQYQSLQFASGSNYLFSGATNRSAYNVVDTGSGTGIVTITLTNAGYTSSTTCGSDYTSTHYAQVGSY